MPRARLIARSLADRHQLECTPLEVLAHIADEILDAPLGTAAFYVELRVRIAHRRHYDLEPIRRWTDPQEVT